MCKIKIVSCLICLCFFIVAFPCVAQKELNAYEKTKKYFSEKTDPTVFKVLSYNVLEGFKRDSLLIKAFQTWVAERDPDVVAFQEMNGFTQEILNQFAKDAGFPYAVLQKRAGFPLALMSKYPITAIKKVTKGMQHGFLYGKISGYHFFVTHLDPKRYEKRMVEVDTLLKYINAVPKTEKILLMGDFNNMSPLDKKDYDNEEKMRLLVNSEKNHPETKVLNDGKIDYSAIQQLLDAGLYDSWRLFNKTYEKSAPTKIKKHHNFTRIDYIYANQTAKSECIDATIVKDEFTDGLSDHYPMLLILKKQN